LIHKKTTSESAGLYYLVQYTSGKVQELVKSCLLMSEESGYHMARNLLQKGYGSSYKVASTYVEKFSSGPAIKAENGEALKRFSLDAMESIQATFTLEDKEHLQSVVSAALQLLRLKLRHTIKKMNQLF